MQVIKVIFLIVLIGFTAWLVFDTIKYIVKKVKNRKFKKKQMSVEQKQEDTTNENESN